MTNQYKVGVLYCKAGQSTEEEMYNNRKYSSLIMTVIRSNAESCLQRIVVYRLKIE